MPSGMSQEYYAKNFPKGGIPCTVSHIQYIMQIQLPPKYELEFYEYYDNTIKQKRQVSLWRC